MSVDNSVYQKSNRHHQMVKKNVHDIRKYNGEKEQWEMALIKYTNINAPTYQYYLFVSMHLSKQIHILAAK